MALGVYTVNFNKVRNNVDFRHVVTLTDGTDPVDVSAADFYMDVVPKIGTATPILELESTGGSPEISLFTDGSDGKVVIHVDHLVMEALTPGSYKYDLVMIRSGVSEVVMEGNFKIKDGVTDLD